MMKNLIALALALLIGAALVMADNKPAAESGQQSLSNALVAGVLDTVYEAKTEDLEERRPKHHPQRGPKYKFSMLGQGFLGIYTVGALLVFKCRY
jgi:hypothetical protein